MENFIYSDEYIQYLKTAKAKEIFDKKQKTLEIDWLVYLSTLENKKYFKMYFNRIITSIDDLHKFINICRKSNLRNGLGRCIKTTVNTWVHNHISAQPDVKCSKIIDIIRITRPCFRHDSEFQQYIRDIFEKDRF